VKFFHQDFLLPFAFRRNLQAPLTVNSTIVVELIQKPLGKRRSTVLPNFVVLIGNREGKRIT